MLTRRVLMACGIAAGALLATGPAPAAAEEPQKRYALSLIEAPRFERGFKSFDWVNPDAPKGGMIRLRGTDTFDSLNEFASAGKGDPALGLGLIYDTLFSDNLDEPETSYGLLAEWISYPADISSATFGLRPEARFNDGTPVTADDVVWSFDALKATAPLYQLYYANVVKAEKTGEHQVTFTFNIKGNRELPQILGQLYVLPKHYWTANGADGKPRNIAETTLEPPIGSGPYRIAAVEPGRSITYERVKDYWAKDLGLAKGFYNYDAIKYVYFRERTAAFEAFKAGDLDEWQESSSKYWATSYDFDAVKKGLVKKEVFPSKRLAPMQAFVFNLRRPQFQDIRVRKAFNLAFDFESLNKNQFYELYRRTGSFFDNSELKATGAPTGAELELLKSVEAEAGPGSIPADVFTGPYQNPVNGTPELIRKNLSEAARMLAEAGYKVSGGVLVGPTGRPLTAEFLIDQPDLERVAIPYVETLKRLGVQASIRRVDEAQYIERHNSFDFDIIIGSFAQSHSPGNEQREFWGSAAADRKGSRNVAGIKNPVIDKLIERLVTMKDRAGVVVATHDLDRVLLANVYMIPQWYNPNDWIAYWDRFGRPSKLPSQTTALPLIWWIDQAKDQALKAARGR